MSRFVNAPDKFEMRMMRTPTEILKNGYWWELRTLEGRQLGRSTGRSIVEGWKGQLATNGFIDDESNV